MSVESTRLKPTSDISGAGYYQQRAESRRPCHVHAFFPHAEMHVSDCRSRPKEGTWLAWWRSDGKNIIVAIRK